MADAIGIDGMHNVSGICELCGAECNSAVEELNALTCTFAQCSAKVYHQDCLEKFLKSIKCEKNRKTGFQCPRGRGKASSDEPCPGRIDKSHPIHPRNDGSKKKKKTKAVDPVQPPPRYGPAAKAARQKEKEERERLKAAQEAEKEANRKAAALAATASKKAKAPANDYHRNKAVAESLKRDLGRKTNAPEPVQQPTPEVKLTFDEYEALRSSAKPAPAKPAIQTVNAWSKPGAADKLQEKVALTPGAFPAMPTAASGPRTRAKDRAQPPPSAAAAPAGAGAWGASQAASDTSYDTEAAAAPALQQLPLQQPPPPPPRSDISGTSSLAPQPQSSQHGAAAAGARAQALRIGGGAPVRMSLASSFSSQLSTSSLQSSLPGGDPSQAAAPVGASYADSTDDARLTKAQKKNLKRAEKKARQANGMCADAPTNGARRRGLTPSPFLQQCLEALARFKAMCCLQYLLGMSFDHWQCVAAIQRVGADVDRATEWICENMGDSRSWPAEVMAYDGPAMYINVSKEMVTVEEALALLPCSPAQLHSVIIQADGNLYAGLHHAVQMVSEQVSSRLQSPRPSSQKSLMRGHANGSYNDVPEAALMAAAAVTHDADATATQGSNFDSFLAAFV